MKGFVWVFLRSDKLLKKQTSFSACLKDCAELVYENTRLKAKLSEPKLLFVVYSSILPHERIIRFCQTVSCAMPRLTGQMSFNNKNRFAVELKSCNHSECLCHFS